RWLITWEIALLLGSGIMAAVALRRAAVGAGGADRAPALAAAANMRRLEEEVLALSKEPDYQRFLPRLRRIFEEIKYSDYAGVSGADEALTERVTGLRNLLAGDEPDKEAALGRRADEISRLLREREREVRLAKASVNTRIP
ncbi:MAG: hypothetical protein LBK98_10955, partial [Peptococcaceae bacterium]|nr:hypothetical protein [Peptococcaceae bacterium]